MTSLSRPSEKAHDVSIDAGPVAAPANGSAQRTAGDGVAQRSASKADSVWVERSEAAAGHAEHFDAARTVAWAVRRMHGSGAADVGPHAVDLQALISCAIAEIERRISAQINAILHHPKFQRLEAAWRGLEYLVAQVDPEKSVRVRALSVSKRDLQRDFEGEIDFDQSELFRMVYSKEYDMPGGTPYGVLISNESFGPDDVELLEKISGVASAAFAPFIAQAAPSLLDVGATSFNRLVDRPFDPERNWQLPEFASWRSFRTREDSRFVALTMPQVIMRAPYTDDGSQTLGSPGSAIPGFREDVSAPDNRSYLWGSAAYAFGGVIIRAFQNTGWFTDIRGVPEEGIVDEHPASGGLVADLPVYCFDTDAPGRPWRDSPRTFALRPQTDIVVTDELERKLDHMGLIALCRCKDAPGAVFYGTPSVQKPRQYEGKDGETATANARLSAMLQHILCASRFAHYIKVMWRDKTGSFKNAEDIERALNDWLSDYKAPEFIDDHPLYDASATVRPHHAGRPGMYDCDIHLQPHVQFDAVSAKVVLSTESPGS